jgi:hypothetical protein
MIEEEITPFGQAMQLVQEHGFDGMAEAMAVLFNEAMKICSWSPQLGTQRRPPRLRQRLQRQDGENPGWGNEAECTAGSRWG